MVERWHLLPLDRALVRLPLVRDLVQGLADETADAERRPRVTVPDHGPAVVIDQLRVMVHDATSLGDEATQQTVVDRLALLRREL